MGTLARTGIFGGKKVDLVNQPDPLHNEPEKFSAFDRRLLTSAGILPLAQRLAQTQQLSVDEVTTLLERASLSVLLKLLRLQQLPEQNLMVASTIFLPLDTWLDRMEPSAVIRRAVTHIRKQRDLPDRVLIEIKDFTDLTHLWPDLLFELRLQLPEETQIVGPDPQVVFEWVQTTDATGSHTVQHFQFQQKLTDLRSIGFDALQPTTQYALLSDISTAGFPVEACTRIDLLTGNEEFARRLVRVAQQVDGQPLELYSWSPTVTSSGDLSLPQAAIDLLLIRAHLIGALVYPGVLQSIDGNRLSESAISFLKSAEVGSQLFVTTDLYTAERIRIKQVGSNQDAQVITGSF